MKINRTVTFTLNNEENAGYRTVLGIFQAIAGDEMISEDIRDRASEVLNYLYEFDNDYLED